jgi:hypothetical protein
MLIFMMGQRGYCICFAYKGGQKFRCDCMQSISGVTTQNTGQKIADALLTLISRSDRERVVIILHIKAANTSIMYNYEGINC